MVNLCHAALEALRRLIVAEDGANRRLREIEVRDGLRVPGLDSRGVAVRHVAADLFDKNSASVYPHVTLYCSRLVNSGRAKFASFSGSIHVAAEIRVSESSIEALDGSLSRYVEALTGVLEDNRGKWADSVGFDGLYEVRFEPVKIGGRNFLQNARIDIELKANV